MQVPRHVLPTVVVGQLLALSLWFSGTAVVPQLGLDAGGAALMTIAVQAGFVVGTLAFAILNVADRRPPERVFLASAIAGAAANALFAVWPHASLRFLTGLALAGVYPVGMKLLATWYARLGAALGFLLAALTLGSGSPYLIRALGLPWQAVILSASALAVAGGVLVFARVKAGPLLPSAARFEPRAFALAFRVPEFRRSALAYFGHMWELYAFWGLVPLFLAARGDLSAPVVAALTFGAFAAGAVACVVGGQMSRTFGEGKVALVALAVSSGCCLASPLLFVLPIPGIAIFLAVWGGSVIADSPQFSAMSAHALAAAPAASAPSGRPRAAPREFVGTALTMQNAVGFAITFGSLALLPWLAASAGWQWAMLALAPGPILGAIAVAPLAR